MKVSNFVLLGFLFTAQIACATGLVGWRHDYPCGHQLPLEKVKLPDCDWAVTAQLPNDVKLSACRPPAADTDIQMRLYRGSKTIVEWSATIEPIGLDNKPGVKRVTMDDVFPVRVDVLDQKGDGKGTVLIAVMDNMGAGMTVTSWSVWSFDGIKLSNSIGADDYGAFSFPVCSRDGKSKFLLSSSWIEGWEPKRGKGLYLSACWFDLMDDGSWVSSSNRPSVYRRYLFGFERLRGNVIVRDTPEPWYRSPATHIQIGPTICYKQ